MKNETYTHYFFFNLKPIGILYLESFCFRSMASEYSILVVSTLKEVAEAIRQHEIQSSFKYVSLKKDKLYDKESGIGKFYIYICEESNHLTFSG